MFRLTFCLLISLTVISCVSTSPKTPNPTFQLNALNHSELTIDYQFEHDSELYNWAEKVNQFYRADASTVILPYINTIRSFDEVDEDDLCNGASEQRINLALSLNPSSLYANFYISRCAIENNQQTKADQYMANVEAIAGVLLSKSSGETLNTAIEVRELDESYLMLELSGFQTLDNEIVRVGDDFVYKFHLLDIELNKFEYRYFKNSRMLKAMYSGMALKPMSTKLTTDLSINTYKKQQFHSALIPEARKLLAQQKYPDVIALLNPIANQSMVATTLLAEAYVKIDQYEKLEELYEVLEYSSEIGLIESNVFIASFILSMAQSAQELHEVDNIIAKVDELTYQGNAIELISQKLATFDNGPELLKNWYSLTKSKAILDAISDVSFYFHQHDVADHQKELALIEFGQQQQHPASIADLGEMYRVGHQVEKDESKALRLLQQAATLGDDGAQLDLGYYRATNQLGLTSDSKISFDWYLKSAKQGNKRAEYNVATYFRKGIGVEQNLTKAIEFYQASIKHGFADSYCELGKIYRDYPGFEDIKLATEMFEYGVTDNISECQFQLGYTLEVFGDKDFLQAQYYYLMAAKNNHEVAYLNLALAYDYGRDGINKDVAAAIKYYHKAAELGEGQAQANLGFKYEEGVGVEKDLDKAFTLYQQSNDNHDAQGTNNLATFYKNGIVVEQDIDMAINLYLKAAEGGNVFALNNLGNMYFEGDGVEVDNTLAFQYYLRASQAGDLYASERIGLFYYDGLGVEQDYDKALQYLVEPSKQGYEVSTYFIGEIYYYHFPETDIASALQYYQLAHEQGDDDGAYELGVIYNEGSRVEQNFERAHYWYNQAIQHSNPAAHRALANLYERGDGVKANRQKAIEQLATYAQLKDYNVDYYLGIQFLGNDVLPQNYALAHQYFATAKLANDHRAINNLGELYRYGRGVAVDFHKAFNFYQQAVALNNKYAMFNLGEMYRDGEAVTADFSQSIAWFERSNLAEGYFQIAKMYQQGEMVAKNLVKANEWLNKAANENHKAATFHLAQNMMVGAGITKDEQLGKSLIEKVANSGYQPAKEYLQSGS